jgi:hypothetical protein
MSYASLPELYPGQYRLDPETGMWVPILSKGKKHPLCQIAFCRRPSEKGAQTGRSTQCGTCRVRLWRANNPIKAHYNAIKNKARRRKIPFGITMAFFEELCEETGFHLLRGRSGEALQLDRIDAMRGYFDDNVQVLTATENRDKLNVEETRSRYEWEEYAASEDNPDDPLPEPTDVDDPF